MAAEVTAIVASSGIVEGVVQSTGVVAKSGLRQVRQWLGRKLGLKLLKNLPTGLEALVYGDDTTPEVLAALSLGGRPGRELSTLALLLTIYTSENSNPEDLMKCIFEETSTPLPTDPTLAPSRMDDGLHKMYLLDGQVQRKMRVHTYSSDTGLSLQQNANLVVVGYAVGPYGVVVYGSTDGRFYYCENRLGTLQCSSVDTSPEGEQCLDVTSMDNGSGVFTVAPGVLDSYPEFFRMGRLLGHDDPGVVQLLGIAEVARSLGVRFAEEMTGSSSEDLLSRNHLRNVHNRLNSDREVLEMPDDIDDLAREACKALHLRDRKYERTRFGTTQETTAAYVEAVRSLAETTGNVGVRATVSEESCLIKSCVVGALGMEPSFAIFHCFRSSRVNVAVSPGCTAIYFPGLNITVAFPDGSATGAGVRTFRPACPFTSDLSETFRILLDLAPKIGEGRLRKVALVLSKELAADPSLVLDPVTENVVRSFGTRVNETPAKHSLINLLGSSSLGGGRLHREATLAGVLCQLGLTFSVAGDTDMRCFFDCCREAGWGSGRGNVGVVVVDCKVDICGCYVYEYRKPDGVFLGGGGTSGVGYYAKLTGPAMEQETFLLGECQQGGNYHLESTDKNEVLRGITPRPFPVKCYVGSTRASVS